MARRTDSPTICRSVPDDNPLRLPPFPELDEATLAAILDRLGLVGLPITPMSSVGIFNRIFAVGDDLVLRVPRQHHAFVAAARREAVAVPTALKVGVSQAVRRIDEVK